MSVIILCGLKNCGKTEIGRFLSGDMGYTFIELNSLTVEEAEGFWCSIEEIQRDLGNTEFMRLEEEAARNFATWNAPSYSKSGAVITLREGIMENRGAVSWLSNCGIKIYLKLSRKLLSAIDTSKVSSMKEEHSFYSDLDSFYTGFSNFIYTVNENEASVNSRRLLAMLEEKGIW